MATIVIKTIQQAILHNFMYPGKKDKQSKNKGIIGGQKPNPSLTYHLGENIKRNGKKSNLLLFLSTVLAMLSFSCQASDLEIINEDSARIEVAIEAGDGKLISPLKQFQHLINAKTRKKVEIAKEDIEDAEVFSVIGKVKMPSLYNRCKGLFIDKDYKIIFVSSKTGGVVCYAEELGLFD